MTAARNITPPIGRSINADNRLPLYNVIVPTKASSRVPQRNKLTASAAILYPHTFRKKPKKPRSSSPKPAPSSKSSKLSLYRIPQGADAFGHRPFFYSPRPKERVPTALPYFRRAGPASGNEILFQRFRQRERYPAI